MDAKAARAIKLLLLLTLFAGTTRAQNSPYSDIALSAAGRPIAGAGISVCSSPGLATTAASVSSNLVTLTMASNPITAGFAANMTLQVSGFTGGDTYLNGGTLSGGVITGGFTILSVTSTTIVYQLTHANASATSNGSAFQQGNISTPCAPLASITSDQGGLVPITQPGLASDNLGNYAFFAVANNYVVQYNGPGLFVRLKPIAVPCSGAAACTFTGPQSFTNLTVSGTGTFTGLQTFTGPVSTIASSPTGATESSTTVTITTTAPCLFTTGQNIVVAGVGVATYNGHWIVLSPGCNGGSTFQYTAVLGSMAASGGGTVSTINPTSISDGEFSNTPWVDIRIYGGKGDAGVTDNTPAFNLAVAAACLAGGLPIYFPNGQYYFNSKPNNIGCASGLWGANSMGANQLQGSVLVANYDEATEFNGFITWDGSFAGPGGTGAFGTGGRIQNIIFAKGPSHTGGTMVKFTGTDDNHRSGQIRIDHVIIWFFGGGNWQHGLVVDGSCCSTVNGQGVRSIYITDLRVSGNSPAANQSVYLNNVAHFFWQGGVVDAGSGGGITVTGTGGVGVQNLNSTDVYMTGVELTTPLVIDQSSNVIFIGAVRGGFATTITANAAGCLVLGKFEGTNTNSSPSCSLLRLTNNGSMQLQNATSGALGASTDGVESSSGAGNLYTRTGATSGALFFGDGTCSVSMGAAFTMNTTCGAGTTWNFTGASSKIVVAGLVKSLTFLADQGAVCTNGELALSAGWQSTGSATVTAVAGNGQTCSWTITTGTTTAANPTVTDTLTNALSTTTVCEMNIHGGTHTAAAGEGFQQTTLSATAPVFTFNGTPTAGGTTYFVTRRCGP